MPCDCALGKLRHGQVRAWKISILQRQKNVVTCLVLLGRQIKKLHHSKTHRTISVTGCDEGVPAEGKRARSTLPVSSGQIMFLELVALIQAQDSSSHLLWRNPNASVSNIYGSAFPALTGFHSDRNPLSQRTPLRRCHRAQTALWNAEPCYSSFSG